MENKKRMGSIVAQKRVGGWQCWVDFEKGYAIKTFKTKKEISKNVKEYLDSIGKPEELNKRVQKMISDIKNSTKIINSSNIPKKMFAYPIFLKNGQVKQKRAIVLNELFNELLEQRKKKEIKKLVDRSIDFLIELWKYKIHEKTFKFYSNLGVLNNEIVLIDLFELTDDKEKVKKQLEKKGWSHLEKIKKRFPSEMFEYFLKQVEKRMTIKKLNEVWGIKT